MSLAPILSKTKPQTAAIDIEICLNCDELTTLTAQVQAARQGGAKRLELCGTMHEQGLTPTVEAVNSARQAWGKAPGLVAMLRPRGGNFYYQADDVALLQQQLSALAEAGADAVELGHGLVDDLSGRQDFVDQTGRLTCQGGRGVHVAPEIYVLNAAECIGPHQARLVQAFGEWGFERADAR